MVIQHVVPLTFVISDMVIGADVRASVLPGGLSEWEFGPDIGKYCDIYIFVFFFLPFFSIYLKFLLHTERKSSFHTVYLSRQFYVLVFYHIKAQGHIFPDVMCPLGFP